jgi:hypothetical protein
MKKIILTIFSFVLLILSTSVFAQGSYEIYVHDVKLEKPQYQVGDIVKGQFSLSNLSTFAQSDIYYDIAVGYYDDQNLTAIQTTQTTSKKGPLFVQSRAKDIVSFEYVLPQTMSGDTAIEVTAYLKDGTLIGQSFVRLQIVGEPTQERALIFYAGLEIKDKEGFETIVAPGVGPLVYDTTQINLTYSLFPTQSEHTITPTLTLYNRTDQSKPLYTQELNSFTISSNESNTITHNLPTDLEPLVYYGVLTFESDTISLDPLDFRYIISGQIATIRNITTDVLEVKEGDNIPVIVTYGGQPYDEIRDILVENQGVYTLNVQVFNENNVEIASVSHTLDMNNDTVILDMPAHAPASKISFSAIIIDQDGKTLSEYQTNLPTQEEIKNQSLYKTQSFISRATIILFVFSVLILILLIYIRKKHPQIISPLSILCIGLGISGIIFGIQDVKAWSLVENYNPIIGTSKVSFSLNSVSSPLPPEIKIYEPGERFNLSVHVTYGDCNNEPATIFIASAKSDNPFMSPPNLPGTNKTQINARRDWWRTNGFVMYQFSGSTGFVGAYTEPIEYIENRVNPNFTQFPEVQKLVLLINQLRDLYLEYQSDLGTAKTQIILTSGYNPQNRYRFIDATFTNQFNSDSRVQSLKSQILAQARIANVYSSSDNNPHAILTRSVVYWLSLTKSDYGYDIAHWAPKLFVLMSNSESSSGFGAHFYTKIQGRYTQNMIIPDTAKGFQDVHVFMYQSANTGTRQLLAKQTICVRGAGVCPGETIEPPICPNLIGTFTKNTQGQIFQNGTLTNYTQDAQGNCIIPPPTCNNDYTEGELICINNLEYAMSCSTNATWQQNPTGKSCTQTPPTSAFYCEASPTSANLNQNVTFTAYPLSATSYVWKRNGETVSTDKTFSRSFTSTGRYTYTVDITTPSGTQTKSCSVSVGTPPPPPPNEDDNPGDTDGTANITSFRFAPSVANEQGQCPLELSAENVTSCTLRNRMNTIIPFTALDTRISITNQPTDIGAWTLTCTGVDETITSPITRSCISNPAYEQF